MHEMPADPGHAYIVVWVSVSTLLPEGEVGSTVKNICGILWPCQPPGVNAAPRTAWICGVTTADPLQAAAWSDNKIAPNVNCSSRVCRMSKYE